MLAVHLTEGHEPYPAIIGDVRHCCTAALLTASEVGTRLSLTHSPACSGVAWTCLRVHARDGLGL